MTVVVKVGGARAVDPAGALADIGTLVDDQDIVLTHGGSTTVDETLERLGLEPEYVETPSGVVGRFTDSETMDVFEMVLPGLLNTEMVAGLQSEGVDAVGLSGVDGKLLYGPRKSAIRVVEDGKRKIRRGDHSGSLKEVNDSLLTTLLADGYTPVVSPPMAGADEADGREVAEKNQSDGREAAEENQSDGREAAEENQSAGREIVTPVNTDADRAAAAIAGALDATLVLLTDVPGILSDPDDEETLIERVETPTDWDSLETAAEGFMGRKVMAMREALDGGAPTAIVADANADEPVSSALDGGGTHVSASALADGDGSADAATSSDDGASRNTDDETEVENR